MEFHQGDARGCGLASKFELISSIATAGIAAGMTVFGYCAVTPQRRPIEAGAHFTFERMRELPRLLFFLAR